MNIFVHLGAKLRVNLSLNEDQNKAVVEEREGEAKRSVIVLSSLME